MILTSDNMDQMHDVIYEAYDYKPTDDEILNLWSQLPEPIKGIAELWGYNDTVFKDKMYEFLIENKENVESK